ncbi:MAG: hypothetical protein K0R03_2171 [Moraxellaceae bacterium]|nr:hypothetical protein [Moraxellaceae bacterium]
MASMSELEAVREECRRLVRRRALVSAGVAVVPVPFLDIVVDARILMELLPEISHRFGLAPERIEHLEAGQKRRAWKVIRARGSRLIGIVLTRQIVRSSFQTFAGRLVARQVAKFIPLGGQLVAAGLGYLVMRRLAYRHIDDCFAVAQALARD